MAEEDKTERPIPEDLENIGMGLPCAECGNSTSWLPCWNCGGEGGAGRKHVGRPIRPSNARRGVTAWPP